MRNKLVYPCSIKSTLWGSAASWKAFFASCWLWKPFSLQNVFEMFEERVVHWRVVRWIWWMRQNVLVQFVQLLKHWLWDVQLGAAVEKSWALSADRCCFQSCSFRSISCVWWASFSAVMVFPGFRKRWWVRLAADHRRVTMISYKIPLFVSHPNPIKKWFTVV